MAASGMAGNPMTEGAPWRHTLRFAMPVLAGAPLQHLYSTILSDSSLLGKN